MIAPCVFILIKIRHAVITKVLCLGLPPITGTHNPVQTGDITIGTLSKKNKRKRKIESVYDIE